jgi:hypothetical protein
MHALERRLIRLDRGRSPLRRDAERMSDADLNRHIRMGLAEIDPGLVAQWDAANDPAKAHDPGFSYVRATAEICRQADEMQRARA